MNANTQGRTPEVVPAILRPTWEAIQSQWNQIKDAASHIQIDITDGVFAGDGTFRQIREFKKLPKSEKIELHMMVHTPGNYVDDIIDLNPARCVFHVESFAGTESVAHVFRKLRESTQTELGLALNPDSPLKWLEEQVPVIDYVLFMGVNPGWSNQPLNEKAYTKIGQWRDLHPDMPIAVDGGVSKTTLEPYLKAGANVLCVGSAIFGQGNPVENLKQLQLLAEGMLY